MPDIKNTTFQSPQNLTPFIGVLFLILYWAIGFDGITFSDDVYYIKAGRDFWNGGMKVNEYHFSSRWGAYVPFGFFGLLFGFSAKVFSLFSLICYILCYLLILQTLQESKEKLIFSLWYGSQVYFLHFISKVYPDSALVLWVSLVPIFLAFRNSKPVIAGIGVTLALLIGFITKETIVLLFPLPLIFLLLDYKSGRLNPKYLLGLFGSALTLGALYLGYFWVEFGDPLYRIHSINSGHYISEFTYADKGIVSILKRLTILPFQTFIERAYLPWILLAIPGIGAGIRRKEKYWFEISVAALCLIVGFWFMSSTLEIYNPIYLNPRHLIIMVPVLSFLVAKGWKEWQQSKNWKLTFTLSFILAALLSLYQEDFKMSGFYLGITAMLWLANQKIQLAGIGLLLVTPALSAIPYQHKLKEYSTLVDALNELTLPPDNQSLLITNNFLKFSEEVLLPGRKDQQVYIYPIEEVDQLQVNPPKEIRVLIYDYYLHSYPKEEVDVVNLELWIEENKYQVTKEWKEGTLWYRELTRED